MKKKLSFLLLIVFVIPILAFWGCGSVETYSISASSSDTQFGIVEGQGTYNDGSDITLTATAWSGSNFVAWVFEEKTELVNGDSYSITNTTENDKIVSSTITFKCSKETAGNYTASE